MAAHPEAQKTVIRDVMAQSASKRRGPSNMNSTMNAITVRGGVSGERLRSVIA